MRVVADCICSISDGVIMNTTVSICIIDESSEESGPNIQYVYQKEMKRHPGLLIDSLSLLLNIFRHDEVYAGIT